MAEDKTFHCRTFGCGAELGLISSNSDGVPQLLVYRHSVDLTAESLADVDVLGPLMGKIAVRCEACDEFTTWWPSPRTMLALLDGMGVEQIRDFTAAFLEKDRIRRNG